mgnify:CR=1 FL=1
MIPHRRSGRVYHICIFHTNDRQQRPTVRGSTVYVKPAICTQYNMHASFTTLQIGNVRAYLCGSSPRKLLLYIRIKLAIYQL